MKKKTVCLDFDGVLNSYASGWTGNDADVPDPPVPGAATAVAWLREDFEVVVYSTRCRSVEGQAAVEAWLDRHGIEVDRVAPSKPPAVLYVDDRGYRFDGDWEKLVAFVSDPDRVKPWTGVYKLVEGLCALGHEVQGDLDRCGQLWCPECEAYVTPGPKKEEEGDEERDGYVRVWLDGRPVFVPRVSCCHLAARGALGLERGGGVARELDQTGQPDGKALTLPAGWEFRADERYVRVGIEACGYVFGPLESPEPWQQDPDAWKGPRDEPGPGGQAGPGGCGTDMNEVEDDD